MNTPRDFSVDRYQNFGEIFTYNQIYIPAKKVFLQGRSGSLTYGRLNDLTARLHRYFREAGLKRGKRAIIISKNGLSVVTLFMACLRYGLTAVILNPEAGIKELNNLIHAAKPSACFLDAGLLQKLDIPPESEVNMEIAPQARYKAPGILSRLLGKGHGLFPQRLNHIRPEDPENIKPVPLDTVAYILFTSGTTSRPKGVEITHGNLLAQMKTFVRHYGYDNKSRLLNILPLHHTDGLTQGPVAAFTAGASVFRPLRFDVGRIHDFLDVIYRYRISHLIAVPSMLQLIDAIDEEADDSFQTDEFKFIISTAGYLDPNLWQRFEERFNVKIVNVYGLTETVCEALYCGPSEETRKIGTIGKPVDTECRIVDNQGNDVAQGETGELWLKGPHIMKGYFEMPTETADVMTEDGWFKTGDLCRVDEGGFYLIVGRKKNVIIVGGTNIYPDDVANILRGLPGVLDAAVWGEEDKTWGEVVVAAVTPQEGHDLDANQISEQFLKESSVEMMPRRIHIVDALPRGPAGKVILRDLQKKIAVDPEFPEKQVAQENDNSLESRVIHIAASTFKCSPDTLDLSSTAENTKGWNSLAHVELLLNIEKQFDIKIEPRDIMAVRSLADACNIVREKAA